MFARFNRGWTPSSERRSKVACSARIFAATTVRCRLDYRMLSLCVWDLSMTTGATVGGDAPLGDSATQCCLQYTSTIYTGYYEESHTFSYHWVLLQ